MTKFESELIDRGYLSYTLDCKEMKYKRGSLPLSTMGNIDNRYIHKDNILMIDKINLGISVMSEDFTHYDRDKEICFGLHEFKKPPTLISPRPRIELKRIVEGDLVVEDEKKDDSMNIVLIKNSFEEIFKAMYDRSIIIKIDLT